MTLDRRHTRIAVHLSAEIRRAQGVFTATTKDLSEGGAALACERPVADGEELQLSLFLVEDGVEDERAPPLVVKARVAWTAEGDDGAHLAGGQFTQITPAQTAWLKNFLDATR